MSKEYEMIIDYIHDCYVKKNFDPQQFEFYKLRSEKEKNRVGIYKGKDRDYFFKIVNEKDFNDEEPIKTKISPYFNIVKKYGYKQYGDLVVNLYERVNTVGINSFNYLRDNEVSIEETKERIEKFFKNYVFLQKESLNLNKMTGDRLSDMWFQGRVKSSGRAEKYYGNKFERLLSEIKTNYSEFYPTYQEFISNINSYLSEQNLLVEAYNHGDFHDFNFSLNGTFWDIETFGVNPLLNDFIIYYWHFYGREDGLIYKYSPWLVPYMNNKLNKEELEKVRKLKSEVILYWYSFIEESYQKYNILENINKEFLFKLFCRMFLIDNILNYQEIDRQKVIEFFNYFLTSLDSPKEDAKKILFKNKIKF